MHRVINCPKYSISRSFSEVKKKKSVVSQMPVAQTCNPSYSGGRDQEHCGSKPARQIVCKTPSQKRAGGVAQGVGPEFKL
jgi:hypothetical protein